jgi:predicted ATPase/transcriptional regulator with XRE-family HTH domain
MTEGPLPSFAEQLRQLRQAAGLSQEELADRAGLTAAAIGALERGERRHPYPHTLRALAEALGLTPADRAALFASVPRRGSPGARPVGGGIVGEPVRWTLPPLPLTPLVGRAHDIDIVTELLQHGNARLVTLTGAGGVGKTRVAVEAAISLRSRFEIGPVWVDLAVIREPALVPSAIARALGLPERGGQGLAEMLESTLSHRRSLLVLDNFEHLLAAAPVAHTLLERCPHLRILVTSREALRVRGEHEVQILPLGLPDPEVAARAESVARAEAVDLFLQRVRAVRPGFVLKDADAPRIAAICSRLDGVPLALELAAVHLKYTSPAVLEGRLRSRLELLQDGPRDLPARQRSLRATVAWSHERLTASERTLFRRLSVFVGGFTAEAAQTVCGTPGESPEEISRDLAGLVDKSVVQAHPSSEEGVRFRMLETIREYALERLIESGEERRVADRHADYFCDLAETAAPHLATASRGVWLQHLDIEMANLRAALDWTTTGGDPCVGLRLAGALGWFWILRGHIEEGAHWVNLLRAAPIASCAPEARARALYGAAAIAWKREDYPVARRCAEESVVLWRRLADRRGLAFALAITGLIATSQGDLDRASAFQQESLFLFREQQDGWGIAYALSNLGDALLQQGDLAAARRNYTESLAEFERVSDPWGCGIVLHTLGALAWAEGDVDTARARYGDSVRLFCAIDNRENVARGLLGLAAATLAQGETEEAARLLLECIAIWRDFGSQDGTALCLKGLAGVQAARGRHREAARLSGAADARTRGGPSVYMVAPDMFAGYERETRKRLGTTEFDRSAAEGAQTPIEELVADFRVPEKTGRRQPEEP